MASKEELQKYLPEAAGIVSIIAKMKYGK